MDPGFAEVVAAACFAVEVCFLPGPGLQVCCPAVVVADADFFVPAAVVHDAETDFVVVACCLPVVDFPCFVVACFRYCYSVAGFVYSFLCPCAYGWYAQDFSS